MPEGYYLSQQKYVQDLLDRLGLTNTRTAETPMSYPSSFVLLMVIFLRILLDIAILLGVWCTL